MRLMSSIAALLFAVSLGVAEAAFAADGTKHEEDVDAQKNSYQLVIEESTPADENAVEASAGSGGVATYSYQPACVRGSGTTRQDFYGCGKQLVCGERGHVYNVWAHYLDESTVALGSRCFEPAEAPVVVQVTAADVLRAFRRVPVPASEVVVQPPGGETLVNLDTVFSTRAESFSRTVGLLGHRVELEISPSEFVWVNGDGTSQVSDWAGRPWREGVALGELITHRYERAQDALEPRVDTTWSARYRVDGGRWRDVGGTVTITGEPYDLAVLSAAPHLSG